VSSWFQTAGKKTGTTNPHEITLISSTFSNIQKLEVHEKKPETRNRWPPVGFWTEELLHVSLVGAAPTTPLQLVVRALLLSPNPRAPVRDSIDFDKHFLRLNQSSLRDDEVRDSAVTSLIRSNCLTYFLSNNNSEKTEKEVKTRKTLRTETKCEQQIGVVQADCRTNAKKRKEVFDHVRASRGRDRSAGSANTAIRIMFGMRIERRTAEPRPGCHALGQKHPRADPAY